MSSRNVHSLKHALWKPYSLICFPELLMYNSLIISRSLGYIPLTYGQCKWHNFTNMLTYLRAGIPFMWGESANYLNRRAPKDEGEKAQSPTEENFDPLLRHSLEMVVIEFPSLPSRFCTCPLLSHREGKSWSFGLPCLNHAHKHSNVLIAN